MAAACCSITEAVANQRPGRAHSGPAWFVQVDALVSRFAVGRLLAGLDLKSVWLTGHDDEPARPAG
jgi:hypothetical protein